MDQDDEFIELHNPTGSPVDLSGWSVQYMSAGGTSFLRFDLPSTTIPAGGYFLAARPEYTGGVTPDATWSNFLMGGGGGHVFLVASTTDAPSCTDPSIVDKVGYGTANCPELLAAPAHAAGESLERAPGAADPQCGNGIDTDDNDADFSVLSAPDPQNVAGPAETSCSDLGNVGRSLYFDESRELLWAGALGATSYKIRRSSNREFMQTHPVPDDTHMLIQLTETTYADALSPGAGEALYYFVNAIDGMSNESPD